MVKYFNLFKKSFLDKIIKVWYNYYSKKEGRVQMNWYTLKREFKEKFPNWSVTITPHCISDTRYTHYYYDVLAYVLNKKTTVQGCLIKDEENKKFILYR